MSILYIGRARTVTHRYRWRQQKDSALVHVCLCACLSFFLCICQCLCVSVFHMCFCFLYRYSPRIPALIDSLVCAQVIRIDFVFKDEEGGSLLPHFPKAFAKIREGLEDGCVLDFLWNESCERCQQLVRHVNSS